MANYGIIHNFPGGTKEQYDNALKALHPADGSLPPGQLLHVAGPSENGWTIVAVHDSQASWEKFRDETLMPGLPTVENSFAGPPEETTFEAGAIQTA